MQTNDIAALGKGKAQKLLSHRLRLGSSKLRGTRADSMCDSFLHFTVHCQACVQCARASAVK